MGLCRDIFGFIQIDCFFVVGSGVGFGSSEVIDEVAQQLVLPVGYLGL